MHRIEAKGVTGQLFAEEVRYVTHGLPHPLGQSLEQMGLSKERCVQKPLVRWCGPP